MKIIKIIFFILNLNLCYAQIAVVNDLDGFVNIRNSPEISNNIATKLINGSIIFCFEKQANWVNIDYKFGKNNFKSGYIYKNKYTCLKDFQIIKQKENSNCNLRFESSNIKVEIQTSKFISKKHNLNFFNQNFLINIDGNEIFGTDGNLPKIEYQTVNIEIDGTNVKIPIGELKNLFEPNFNATFVNYDNLKDILYIYASNSDGAGGYEVVWIIENKKFKKREIASGF